MILGLDVSTSTVGFCVLDRSHPRLSQDRLVEIHAIDLTRIKGFWDKVDELERRLSQIHIDHPRIDEVVIEEPLMRFSAGMSSAATITTLMRFNGITCHIARRLFRVEPVMISASTARKACGIKLVTRAKGGSQKDQVFDHMRSNDLRSVVWPTKKNGSPVDWSKDATDAYVVATGHVELNVEPSRSQ